MNDYEFRTIVPHYKTIIPGLKKMNALTSTATETSELILCVLRGLMLNLRGAESEYVIE